ncbi:hypothetical protein CK500_04160 [Halorubrum salipaludis]|uniref:Uncharacterized protein n=1 Tax=Halorubrum salipaludis TaxID=2032630 RepID=A0A2A2FID5_9EURY|nr:MULTISPECIES: hypothetical protein [Halorubrum]PAU84718.1 hypothetical protein CK500_04160 [Halorubrum salipaludis]
MPSVLQVGVPGGAELIVVLLLAAVAAVAAVCASLIIYLDAVERNSGHVLAWTIAALLGGVVVWTLYLVVRDEVGGNGLTASSRP